MKYNNDVVTLESLNSKNILYYHLRLIKNLITQQKLNNNIYKLDTHIHVSDKTIDKWNQFFAHGEEIHHKAFMTYPTKFILDQMLNSICERGINFKNVVHLATRQQYYEDINKILQCKHLKATFSLKKEECFRNRKLVLIQEILFSDQYDNPLMLNHDDVLISGISDNYLQDIKNTPYTYDEYIQKNYTSKIVSLDYDYKSTVFLPINHGKKYGKICGDMNPYHTSRLITKGTRFKKPFMQGSFFVNFVLFHASKFMNIKDYDIYFVRPAILGQHYTLKVKGELFEISNEINEVVCFGHLN